ncbi:hypothetical protein [Rhodococcoides fascians]|uniref:hypothetical protein n=1 Tax=Rhodococcoides fascians TaxID=1828 RepID=UPI00050C2B67|nr:hypothetical protein [Rhodococcus fascians]
MQTAPVYTRSFAIDPAGIEPPTPILEVIAYDLDLDGKRVAAVITTSGDVIDVPIANIVPAHAIVAPAITYAGKAVA